MKEKGKKEMKRWRREGGTGEGYKKVKRKYKALYERKKKEEAERWKKEVREARTEEQVWKIVNRERNKRKKVSEG